MQLRQANAPFRGVPAENVFCAYSDQNIYLGYGLIYPSEKKELFPSSPLQMYILIEATESARTLILGALIAKASEIKRAYGKGKARVYTILGREDEDMLMFYASNGFNMNAITEEISIDLSRVPMYGAPMGYKFLSTDISKPEDLMSYLERTNAYRISELAPDYVAMQMQNPICQALAYYDQANYPAAEILVTGDSHQSFACVLDLHVRAVNRGRGLGKSLLADVGRILFGMGFNTALIHAQLSDPAQQGMLKHYLTQERGVVNIMPSVML